MDYINLLNYKIVCVRLDGLDWYIEKLGGGYLALSKYAPDLVQGCAEIYPVSILGDVLGSNALRDWAAA